MRFVQSPGGLSTSERHIPVCFDHRVCHRRDDSTVVSPLPNIHVTLEGISSVAGTVPSHMRARAVVKTAPMCCMPTPYSDGATMASRLRPPAAPVYPIRHGSTAKVPLILT